MSDAQGDASSPLAAEVAELRHRLAEAESRLAAGGDDRFRHIVESIVDYAILATDRDGIVTDWNEAAEATLGWSARQMIGRPIATIFTPEDVALAIPEREMRFSLTSGKARDERWHMRADGERFYASGQMTPLFDGGEEPIGFLKILRDRTGEEQAQRELEASRERLQLALDASAIVGTWDWEVDRDLVRSDARFAALYGVDPEAAARGLPITAYTNGIHPEDAARVGEEIGRAIETEGAFSSEYRTLDAEGTVHVVRARGRCFRDAGGRRFPGAIVDVTAERRREARQRAILLLGEDLLDFGREANYTERALETLGTVLGLDRVGYLTLDADERFGTVAGEWTSATAVPLDKRIDMAPFGPALLEALRAGTLAVADVAEDPVTQPALAAFQALGIAALLNMPVVEHGRVRVILYLHDGRRRVFGEDDIAFVREVLNRAWSLSQRREGEQALIAAETRLRLAQEAADIGTFDYDVGTGELIWDARCRAGFGIFDDRPISYEGTFRLSLHPDDLAAVDAAVARTLDPAGDGRFDCIYRTVGREDGVVRTIHASGQTIVEDGRTLRFVGATRDVTEEKEAEERQKLLTRELQHRVKNTLAMVNALANQTLRRAANAQEGLAAFSARLIALSHAHDILTQTSWTSAPIGAIVEESLATHQGEGRQRVRWTGPDVPLTAKQSLALALALHELATNAAKYGALSVDAGLVDIAWRIDHGPDGPRLAFEWRESGGPPVARPAGRGFGSRLIEQSLALEFGGTVELDYDPAGVVCRIDAPMRADGGEIG